MIQQLLLDEFVDEAKVTSSALIPIPEAPPLMRASWEERVRRVVNSLVSLSVLTLSSPLLLVLGVLIRLESPGPVLYRGLRIGRNGRLFSMLKLRTLRVGAEQEIGISFARTDAPYATRIGKFLRHTKFDELPQFYNVLRGDMNLVGPRPVRPICADHFGRRLPGYTEQFRVRPGITGLSQLKAGDHAHASLKLKYDLEYLQHRSLSKDLEILFMTGMKVLGIQFRMLARFLGNRWVPANLLPRDERTSRGTSMGGIKGD